MPYNFLRGNRDQPFLLPPDLRDWLPNDHLAWFILDVVDQLDLAPFYLAHRNDGHGHPAYDPKTLLSVLLYGYCIGVRSSRQLERRCHEDIAFRVLAANQLPDHVTIARFRVRHEQALAGFLVQSLRLCAAAGMVRVGTLALDGRPMPPVEAFLRQSQAVLGHDASAQLGKIAAPTQVTLGRRDLVCSTRFIDALTGGIADTELVVFEDCSHAPIYENVPDFNAQTLAFLQRHSG